MFHHSAGMRLSIVAGDSAPAHAGFVGFSNAALDDLLVSFQDQ